MAPFRYLFPRSAILTWLWQLKILKPIGIGSIVCLTQQICMRRRQNVWSSRHKGTNFGELHEALKSYQGDTRWVFRGHHSAEWKLLPKAGRVKTIRDDEHVYFSAWKRRAVEYVDSRPNDDWDWLSIAQHHGMSTRLLDWTSNPLVAAFFSQFLVRGTKRRYYMLSGRPTA